MSARILLSSFLLNSQGWEQWLAYICESEEEKLGKEWVFLYSNIHHWWECKIDAAILKRNLVTCTSFYLAIALVISLKETLICEHTIYKKPVRICIAALFVTAKTCK